MNTFWDTASTGKRAGLIVGALAIIALTVAMAKWALVKDYQLLFADLSDQDAAAMVAELDRMKLPYELAGNGSKIMVPAASVHKTRLKLVAKNLPAHGSVGFEIFNNTDFGMTEFTQKVNYLRALQGELTRTILALDEIQTARVHLVLPEGGLFKRGDNHAKASVTLGLKPGRSIDKEQVAGIQKLVAASVPDIDPAGVTVLGSSGVALNGGAATRANSSESGDWKLEAKRQVEDYLARKIGHLVDRAVGAGRGSVSVDVQLSLDNVKVTAEEVLPAKGAGDVDLPSGVLVRERQTTRNAAAGAASAADGSKEPAGVNSMDAEYQVGRRVQQIVSTPGSIERITLGVILPADIDADQEDKLRDLISAAAGLDTSRGDSLAVHTLKAAAGEAASAAQAGAAGDPAAASDEPTMLPEAAQLPAGRAAARRVPAGLADARVILLLCVLAVVLFAAGWWGSQRSARQQGGRSAPLSDEQRQRMLAEIKGWLADSGAAPGRQERA